MTLNNPTEELFGEMPSKTDVYEEGAIFVFRAAALLTPYRLDGDSWEDLSELLEELVDGEELFATDFCLEEFADARANLLKETHERLLSWRKRFGRPRPEHAHSSPLLKLDSTYSQLSISWDKLARQADEYVALLNSVIERIEDWNWNWKDGIREEYAKLFANDKLIRCSEHFLPDQECDAHSFVRRLPSKVDRFEAFWKSIVSLANKKQSNVILVSDADDEEWVVGSQRKVLCVRPELFRAFKAATGLALQVVDFSQFLSFHDVPKKVVLDLSLQGSCRGGDWFTDELYHARSDTKKLAFDARSFVKRILDYVEELDIDSLVSCPDEINQFVTSFENAKTSLNKNLETMDVIERIDWFIDSLLQIRHCCWRMQDHRDNTLGDVGYMDHEADLAEIDERCCELLSDPVKSGHWL